MKIGDIIKKVLAGDALSDDEKNFLSQYDEQSAINAAAAKARRDAEAKAEAAAKALEELKAESSKTVAKKDADYTALSERVKALETAKSESDAKLAKINRSTKIREAFEKAGIKAAKGVSEAAFTKLVEIATETVDTEQEESLKTAIETFRTEYAGVIAADGATGTGRTQNRPSLVGTSDDNPWAKGKENLTKQCEIALADPAKAKQLQEAANVAQSGGNN